MEFFIKSDQNLKKITIEFDGDSESCSVSQEINHNQSVSDVKDSVIQESEENKSDPIDKFYSKMGDALIRDKEDSEISELDKEYSDKVESREDKVDSDFSKSEF